jgi:hypothetical protein
MERTYPAWDRWIQRAAVACMVGFAVALVGVGIALYAPRAEAPGAPQDIAADWVAQGRTK